MGRDINGRPIIGTAVPRPRSTVRPLPLFGGVGWNLAFVGFDPYYYGYGYGYGNSAWLWGRYGSWYDPYAYYSYDPYYYSPGYYSGGGYRSSTRESSRSAMGSLRLKASPKEAKVYVDGTLMGRVDDFDGMTHHLDVALGAHQIELRADGYKTLATDVVVTTGTTTVRLSLKKK